MARFRDRREAGVRLGERLKTEHLGDDCVVLGLARGGVPVAAEVAASLGADLDVLNVRKIGAPFNPELAIGAVASGGVIVRNEHLISRLGVSASEFGALCAREKSELARRDAIYRGGRPSPALNGRTVVVVDDGAATGATMEAAVLAVRKLEAARIIVALPTCAEDAYVMLRRHADDVIVISMPEPYFAVGAWYQDFHQVEDAAVTAALDAHSRRRPAGAPRDQRT